MLQRRSLAFVLAFPLLAASASPARADDFMDRHFDSPIGPDDGKVPTAKKVVVVTLLTGSLVSFGASFVYLFKANGAEGDRKDLLSTTGGGTESGTAQCTSPAQCAELEGLKQKRDDAMSTWETTMVLGTGLALGAVAAVVLWPNVERDKVRISPQTGQNGNGLVLEGSF